MHFLKVFIIILAIVTLSGCKSQQHSGSSSASSENATAVSVVEFSGENAYSLVKLQCDFGPRVPGTPAHGKCADWL